MALTTQKSFKSSRFSTSLVQMLLFFAPIMALAQTSASQTYPDRPIRLVVPFPPGGSTDALARSVADKLSQRQGQTVIVDNKPGAAGIIGTDAVAKAKGDGYTLLMALSNSLMTNQFLYPKLPYSTDRDLTLVHMVGSSPLVLAVHPSLPVNSVSSLFEHLKANPGKINYGSYGQGSYAHLAGAYIDKKLNAKLTHVPYKGEAPMIQELIQNSVQMAFASAMLVKPQVDAGKLKVIGLTGVKRIPIFPDLPTFSQQGIDDDAFRIVGWAGLAAPASTSPAIVRKLSEEMAAILKMPEIQNRLDSFGIQAEDSSPELFLAKYRKDSPVWQKLVKDSGAQLE